MPTHRGPPDNQSVLLCVSNRVGDSSFAEIGFGNESLSIGQNAPVVNEGRCRELVPAPVEILVRKEVEEMPLKPPRKLKPFTRLDAPDLSNDALGYLKLDLLASARVNAVCGIELLFSWLHWGNSRRDARESREGRKLFQERHAGGAAAGGAGLFLDGLAV